MILLPFFLFVHDSIDRDASTCIVVGFVTFAVVLADGTSRALTSLMPLFVLFLHSIKPQPSNLNTLKPKGPTAIIIILKLKLHLKPQTSQDPVISLSL